MASTPASTTSAPTPTATIALLLAASADEASVAGTKEGVGPAGATYGLAKHPGKVAVPVPGRTVAFGLAGRGVDAGGELRPRREVGGGGESGHVEADLGDDDRGRDRPDPGSIEPGDRASERGQLDW